ncbi:MAG: hypothetical protein ACE5IG_05760 [Dehalococcoidia bacterium]
MVKDTRAQAGAGDVRALNRPSPVAVRVGEHGYPAELRLRGRWVAVESVADRWRIDDEWWRGRPVSRLYYECLIDQGLRVTVFQDLVTSQWYRQRS